MNHKGIEGYAHQAAAPAARPIHPEYPGEELAHRRALDGWLAEFRAPRELTVTVLDAV